MFKRTCESTGSLGLNKGHHERRTHPPKWRPPRAERRARPSFEPGQLHRSTQALWLGMTSSKHQTSQDSQLDLAWSEKWSRSQQVTTSMSKNATFDTSIDQCLINVFMHDERTENKNIKINNASMRINACLSMLPGLSHIPKKITRRYLCFG